MVTDHAATLAAMMATRPGTISQQIWRCINTERTTIQQTVSIPPKTTNPPVAAQALLLFISFGVTGSKHCSGFWPSGTINPNSMIMMPDSSAILRKERLVAAAGRTRYESKRNPQRMKPATFTHAAPSARAGKFDELTQSERGQGTQHLEPLPVKSRGFFAQLRPPMSVSVESVFAS